MKLGIHIVHDIKVIHVHLLRYLGHIRRDRGGQQWRHQRWACSHLMTRIYENQIPHSKIKIFKSFNPKNHKNRN